VNAVPGRQRKPDVVRNRQGQSGLEEEREKRVEPKHEAVTRVANVASNLVTEKKRKYNNSELCQNRRRYVVNKKYANDIHIVLVYV
jgi:hypothetical protein